MPTKSSLARGRASRRWLYPCVAVFCLVGANSIVSSRGLAEESGHCSPIAGASPILERGALVLIGEMHGTVQMPRFAGDLACAALARGLRVDLGLEIPSDEESRLAKFLASDGGQAARLALFENSTFWQSSMQDGRRSEAMFDLIDLIDRVRRMRQAGKAIALTPIDRAEGDKSRRRDEVMARNVREIVEKANGGVTIVLTGNIHSRLMSDAKNPDWGIPMGAYLRDLGPASLAPSYAAGKSWACMPTCGEQVLKSTAETIERRDDEIANHVFGVGALTASPPAYRGASSNEPQRSTGRISSPKD